MQLNAALKDLFLFRFGQKKKKCVWKTSKKILYLCPQFFCLFFFFVFWHAPMHHTIRISSNGQKFFFDLSFLRLAFFPIFIPLNKFIIVTVLTVIMPYFYLLLCHRQITDKSQSVWHCGPLPCVLKRSGIIFNNHGSMHITMLHISRVIY